MSKPDFGKRVVAQVVNDVAPSQMNTFHTVGDMDNDGLPDIVICGRNGRRSSRRVLGRAAGVSRAASGCWCQTSQLQWDARSARVSMRRLSGYGRSCRFS